MMNNCQKCGNPLQPGVTICPICGTNRSEVQGNIAQQNPLETMPRTNNMTQMTPAGITNSSQPVSVSPTTNNVTTPTGVQNVETINSTPTAPQPSVTPSNLGANSSINTTTQPSLNTIAPSVSIASTPQPIPNLPAGTTIVKEETQPVEKKAKKKGFSKNQKVIIFGALAIVLIIVVYMMMSNNNISSMTPNTPAKNNHQTNQTPDEGTKEVALKEAITNGYKLKYEEGWIIEEDSYNVLLKKSDDSVVIKLEHFSYNLSDFDKGVIETYLSSRDGLSNPKVEATTIGGKDAYLMSYNVNTQTSVSYPVESYFINGGSNLIIGATIVYLSDSVKEANAATVLSLMGNISYADESVKALDSINMYYNAFSLYADIIGNSKEEVVPETPEEPVSGTPEGDTNGAESPNVEGQENQTPDAQIP